MKRIDFFNLISMLHLVIFTFFFQARKGSAVDESFTICSVPTYCVGLNIKFPFFIEEQLEHRCGYPGFHISCRNHTNPVLSLLDGDYIIRDIDYQNQSFHVSKAVDLDRDDFCSHSIRNISLPGDRFILPQNQREMILLFDCNSTSRSMIPELSRYEVDCGSGNESNTTLAVLDNDPRLNLALQFCTERVSVPVAFSDGEGDVEDVVNRGFVLDWIAYNCSVCEESGGKCGFDYMTYHFKCFCRDRPHAARCSPVSGKNNFVFKLTVGLGSSIVGITPLIILTFCFIKKFLFWKLKTQENKNIEVFLKDHDFLAPKRYMYSDIKNMTNSFRDKLGKGGYGDVYKGKLLDGRHVAVKILKNKSQSNGEEFINEVASISRTSHVNIVTLLGFCIEGPHRALVYEFMPNGSLEKFIFQDKADRTLTWEKLYRIAIGIARGLEYLHRGCNTRILHLDIKPHNVLLDDELCPKISDFGLAKSCLGNESFVSMTGARGTIGYIAPEVFSRNFGRVSHKSDVYSYGMMILEMVGGRQNINVHVDHTSEIYFPDWIYSRVQLDEELELEGITNDDQEKVKKMIIVSLWSIQTDPSNRPSMSRVVEMLEGSIDSLTIPPKPFLSSSPPRAPTTNSSSTSTVTLNSDYN